MVAPEEDVESTIGNLQHLNQSEPGFVRFEKRFIRKDGKMIWSNPAMQFREEYPITGTVTDPNAFFGQDVNALDRLAAEFARTLVSSILEAF